MTSVKVAVRVRPLNKREEASTIIIAVNGNKTQITNPKVPEVSEIGDVGREDLKLREFTFDHSFWSADGSDAHFVSQQQVYAALGPDVLSAVYEGYNICVFAYGQTGSGKTYTMMGSQESPGFIPRFCEAMFERMHEPQATYKTEVSYLEIYNEKVRDLLKAGPYNGKSSHNLRIREHPKDGPYVQDLSQHTVVGYTDIGELMQKGNNNRVTAPTVMNDASSRSHAIFTISFTQAKFHNGLPSEKQSKIHLVDLAGSERADASGATGQRLKEGGSINKSLVTLGSVISTLAEASEGKATRKQVTFIPYRDSQLTWLLKDSLGGNAKTVMIATISPADINYGETMSTLRYASRAKSIINKPKVNEDPNVRLIRELRAEIARLRALLGANMDSFSTPKVHEKLHENEARIKVLTEEWTDKWRESASVLQEEKNLELRKEGSGVILDSSLPHLISVDNDILGTGIMLCHIKEGLTTIGTDESEESLDIVISGENLEPDHCVIEYIDGSVTLHPIENAACSVNGTYVMEPVKLNHGAVILLGQSNIFRFNHPMEAQKLKQIRKSLSTLSLSKSPALGASRTSLLNRSLMELYRSNDSLSIPPSWELEEKQSEEGQNLVARKQEIQDIEENRTKREREWELKHHQLKERLNAKQQELSALQQKLEVLKQTMSPARSVEEALRRLEEQENAQVQETRRMKEELLHVLHELSINHSATKSSIAMALKEMDQLLMSRQVQISGLQDETEVRRQSLQEQLEKEGRATDELQAELTALQKEVEEEKDKLLCHNSQLKTSYSKLCQAETKLRKTHDKMDLTKNAQWKKTVDRLKEEHHDIENAWKDLIKQESELDKKVAKDRFLSEAEQHKCQEEKDRLIQVRTLLKQKEEKASATHQVEMERVQSEMEKWSQQKSSELLTEEKKQMDLFRQESKKMNSLCQQVEAKLSKVKVQEQKRQNIETLLKRLDSRVQSQISELQEEVQMIQELKEKKLQERIMALEDKERVEADVQSRLKELQGVADTELQKIQEEKRRLLSQQGEDPAQHRDHVEYSDSAAMAMMQWRQKEVNEKTQECRDLREEIRKLQEELTAQQQQQEEEREMELDSIEFKKFQVLELERQERINALVEQEVKRRTFEEKVEREKQLRLEREQERQDREREIHSLKLMHDSELQKLKERLQSSNGLNKDSCGLSRTPSFLKGHRRKLVRQLRCEGLPFPLQISIPNFALHGSGWDSHYEYEVRIQIGSEVWSVFRRYSQFRQLHQTMTKKYPEVESFKFPPRRLFHKTERVTTERRVILEQYLRDLMELSQRDKDSVLHPDNNLFINKHIMADFDPFFKRGLFEHTRHVAS